VYYYLIFRIYLFYIEVIKERDMPLLITSVVVSTLVFFNVFTLYAAAKLYLGFEFMYEVYALSILGFILFLLNYFLFLKPKEFLERNFDKSVPGSIGIVIYILITVIGFIIVGI